MSPNLDAVEQLCAGFDHVVDFTTRYPHLYAAATTRMLAGVRFAALEASNRLLLERVQRASEFLRVPPETAVALLWSGAQAACLLQLSLGPVEGGPAHLRAVKEAVMARIFQQG